MFFPRNVQLCLLLLINMCLAAGSVTILSMSSSTKASMAIWVLFPIIGCCSLISASMLGVMLKLENQEQQEEDSTNVTASSRIRTSIWFIFPSAISLWIILLLRLTVGESHFQGNTPQLDFGPKDGIDIEDNTNIAFESHSFNTYGHCLQGFLASFLQFPITIITLKTTMFSRGGGTAPPSSSSSKIYDFLSIISSFMLVYPTYNFVKRWDETFATSSFSNNATEWSMGFLVGFSLGLLCYTRLLFSARRANNNNNILDHVDNESNSNNDEKNNNNDDNNDVSQGCSCSLLFLSKFTLRLQQFMAFLLLFTVFGASILFGLTWNTCKEEEDLDTIQDDNCLNYSDNGDPNMQIVIGFLIVPIVIHTVVIIISKRCSSGLFHCFIKQAG